MMDTSAATAPGRIPQRPYGSKHGNPRLADEVSIVGLGCSSFSGFFGLADNDGNTTTATTTSSTSATTTTAAPPDWISQTTTRDVQTVNPQHPLVRQWIDTIHYAIREAGITLLDTAPWYGHGVSEQVVGIALDELFTGETKRGENAITRKDITLNTKVGRYEADPCQQFDFGREATLTSVQRSLQRLRTSYIDVLQLHDPEFAPTLDILLDETVPAMLTCQRQGRCRALGLTGYPLSVQRQIFQATLDKFGRNIWDQALTYGHYTLHDTTLLRPCPGQSSSSPPRQRHQQDNDDEATSYADFLQSHDCACLAAAPLSMGLLTRTASPPAWHPALAALQATCREAAEICRRHQVGHVVVVDLAELAIFFALAEPRIPVTLLGMKNVAQVQIAQRIAQRLRAADYCLEAALSDQERLAYEQIVDPQNGPFAAMWKSSSNDYRWDGIRHVREFWRALPDRNDVQDWQHAAT